MHYAASAGTASGWNNTSIAVVVPSGATTGSVVVTVNGMASNGVPFTVAATPVVSSVTPTTGTAGTSVTLSGSGFGAVQGSGVVWLGSTPGTVVSWSDTQVVATVASNATSGTARVQQSGLFSNSVPFTVNTATITSVSPANGVAGTSVAIAGSGFGAAQGTGQVWLGTLNGAVQSWSDTQVVALVATGSASANAQVLQGGVISNAIPFTVNTIQLTSISPASGSVGTAVTFTGMGFGAAQGSGVAWLGSTAGQVVTWSDTQLVATVAPGAVTGIARVQQNGVWSNAFGFTVPASGGGGSVTSLSPSLINMAVGDTHSIQASNAAGQPVTGLTWTTSDSTVVSLSTDDPPVLTALAVGHVTIMAGSASADVTVMAGPLALGTVLWSNPGDGSDVVQIIPAVPSATGVADVFAIQDDGTTVQAITSDGTLAWTAAAVQAGLPDFQGGLIVGGPGSSIMKLDGLTGLPYPAYSPGGGEIVGIAVHPDGTIFAHERTSSGSDIYDTLVGIDPTTGTQKFSVSMGAVNNLGSGDTVIAGDGYAYAPYSYLDYGCSGSECQNNHFGMVRVGSDGSYTDVDIFDWTSGIEERLGVPGIITNADTGVLLTWQIGYQPYMAIASGGAVSLVQAPAIPNQQASVEPVVQAQDGSYVGTVSDNDGNYYMIAFDLGGNVRWTVPNETPRFETFYGSVVGQSGIIYDQNGNAIGIPNLATQSWGGNEYTASSGLTASINVQPVAPDGASFWPQAGGNPSGNGTALAQCSCYLQSTGTGAQARGGGTAARAGERNSLRFTVSPPPPGPAPPAPPTYLLLVGDPGLNQYNVMDLFNLAAGTEQDTLNEQGNVAFSPVRVSTVQDFAKQLVSNGPITGAVEYFGHGAALPFGDGSFSSILAPGEQAGANTNVTPFNVNLLSNSQLDTHAMVILHSCLAGYGGKRYSIAQLIANQLQRVVMAATAGTFFSTNPSTKFAVNGLVLPNQKPIYSIQDGGVPLIRFLPSLSH
ncbi:MAG TPA: IPT/TIG domain-containing protein [Bryobacteraceae bacterium]|nr:IPT/TIG domain-containing protein [Bryobacteraceae bacterium]